MPMKGLNNDVIGPGDPPYASAALRLLTHSNEIACLRAESK